MRNTKRNAANVREIRTADIFAAACAAQRINGGYVKESTRRYNDDESYVDIVANKIIVRNIINGQIDAVTDDDRVEADAVRSYWRMKMFAVLGGTASSFTTSCVSAASTDYVLSDDLLSFGIISYMPEGYAKGMVRDQREEQRADAELLSDHFGAINEKITGEVRVIDCVYSKNYMCYYVTGTIGRNAVMWSSKNAVDAGKRFKLVGRVKRHRDNNVTQLNYVKLKA